ncbi:MAG: hypothetical protein NC429_00965 [Lachnospiraceae bacterium]|nr:hypothetical protein [Lachnospiraceae bacterium]
MKKKILVMLLFVALILTACGEKKEDLTGVWIEQEEDGTSQGLQLYSDGTGIITDYDSDGNQDMSYSCTWIAENERIKFTIDYGILGSASISFKYEVKSNELTLWDDSGEMEVYKKEK